MFLTYHQNSILIFCFIKVPVHVGNYCFAVCYLNIKYTFSIKRNVKNKAFIFVYEGLHGSRVLGPGNMDVSTDTTAPQ